MLFRCFYFAGLVALVSCGSPSSQPPSSQSPPVVQNHSITITEVNPPPKVQSKTISIPIPGFEAPLVGTLDEHFNFTTTSVPKKGTAELTLLKTEHDPNQTVIPSAKYCDLSIKLSKYYLTEGHPDLMRFDLHNWYKIPGQTNFAPFINEHWLRKQILAANDAGPRFKFQGNINLLDSFELKEVEVVIHSNSNSITTILSTQAEFVNALKRWPAGPFYQGDPTGLIDLTLDGMDLLCDLYQKNMTLEFKLRGRLGNSPLEIVEALGSVTLPASK